MKVKTAELTGLALDWALAAAIGLTMSNEATQPDGILVGAGNGDLELFDHTDPATCMGLIKKHRANVDHTEHAPKIEVSIWYEVDYSDDSDRMTDADFDCQLVIGDTVEQAVARCVVQTRLGGEVEVPDELGVQS